MGSFFYDISIGIMELSKKIVDMLSMQVNISFVNSVLKFFGGNIELPTQISLLSIITTLGAGALLIILIYNIFKP